MNLNARLKKIDKQDDVDLATADMQNLLTTASQEEPEHEQPDADVDPSILSEKVPGKEYLVLNNVKVSNPSGTWKFVHPVNYIYPVTLRGTVQAVQDSEAQKQKVRALGSRHSFSTVDQTYHAYIDMSRAHPYVRSQHNDTVGKLDQTPLSRLNASAAASYINVPGGFKIHQLNHILCPDNGDKAHFGKKRMFNMGGGDVQAFAGAFSTGTHGSGGIHSAYHDMIRSIVLVASGGRVYRVEPAAGITDPAKHKLHFDQHPNEVREELIQNDDRFYSLLVSMGCFGVIFSCVLEITEMSLLHEDAYYMKGDLGGWTPEVKAKFTKPMLPASEFFYYMQFNPYKLKGQKYHSAIIKEIKLTNNPGSGKKETRKKVWPTFLSGLRISAKILRLIANAGMTPKPKFIETALKAQNDNVHDGKGYTDLAYKIWSAGTGKLSDLGTAIEFAFPTPRIPEILDYLFSFLEYHQKQEKGHFLNAPVALRFVRPSNVYLAPNYKEAQDGTGVPEWCYIEILRVNSKDIDDDERELKLFEQLQNLLFLKGGRPHWGLNFNFPFREDILDKMYPKFDEWLAAYLFFNENGVFDNEFTASANLREAALRKATPVPSPSVVVVGP